MKAIYFDMDGTVYDLYGVDNWERMLRDEDDTAYRCGNCLGDIDALNALLDDFVALGITIGVITWTAMNGSKEYNKRVRNVKKQWIAANMPCVSEFHCVKYGTPKHRTATIKDSVLVDDNAAVRKAWKNGATIDASNFEEIVESLEKLLRQMIKNDTM